MRVIAFKIWGDYAHFRRHYTTSSPLTHTIPPPSALRGIVGGIMGFSRDRYPERLPQDKCFFGVRLLSPVKKIRLGMNYMDTKDGSWVELDPRIIRPKVKKDTHGGWRLHTQVRLELLSNPSFEIFFHHRDAKVMDELKKRLENHSPVFTPYLGITECIANFQFLWDENVEPFEEISDMVSAFKVESLEELNISDDTAGISIVKELVPCFIDSDRIRISGCEVAFCASAVPIKANVRGSLLYPGDRGKTFAFIG